MASHFVALLEDPGTDDIWLFPWREQEYKFTYDDVDYRLVRVRRRNERAFWTARPAEGWDVPWCARGQTMADIFEEAPQRVKEMWDELGITRLRKTFARRT